MEFSRQGIMDCVAISSSKGFPDPGIEPRSPPLQADFLPSEPRGNPNYNLRDKCILEDSFTELTPRSNGGEVGGREKRSDFRLKDYFSKLRTRTELYAS